VMEKSERKILPEIKAISEYIINTRRHLHRNPELSYKEFKTAAFIATELRKLDGLEIVEKVAQTGIVATLKGGISDGPCILLRADMDALPIQEVTSEWNKEYKSLNDGVHHACGHDGHVAMLLGAAKVLTGLRHSLKGCVKFLFQPAEEAVGGAKPMIEEGVLDGRIGPKVDQVYGIHLSSKYPPGIVALRNGPMMASCDLWYIHLHGQGGHAAYPSATKDPIMAGCQMVGQLHTIISRNVSPLDSAVVSIGKFHSGTKENIIPTTADLEGTVRTFDSKIKSRIKQRMSDICDGITKGLEVKATLHYSDLYPVTINSSPSHVQIIKDISKDIVGSSHVIETEPILASEDFSYFLQERPGCFFFVGASLVPEGKPILNHHSPEFDFHEDALFIGSSIWVNLIRHLLQEKKLKSAL